MKTLFLKGLCYAVMAPVILVYALILAPFAFIGACLPSSGVRRAA